MTRKIKIGDIYIGGGSPVRIQSMTNADTCDTEAVASQINELEAAGCEIVRVAAYNTAAARNIRSIKDKTRLPIVADVHFDHRIAIAAIEAGADKVRINPGNIGSESKVAAVVDAAKAHGIPLRVGANTGSLKKELYVGNNADSLVKSALENIRTLERLGFYDIVVSLKSSNVRETISAYRRMSALADYPLHLGVTEAGLYEESVIKSAIGIGSLLADGIGDTVRVSVTGGLKEEVEAAKRILKYSGARSFGAEVIACPTCSRTSIDVAGLAARVTEAVKDIDKPVKIAVMGCVVNGPGEARGCDVGVAGGGGEGILFVKGECVRKGLGDAEMLGELVRLAKAAAQEY